MQGEINRSILTIRGIGEKRAGLLSKLGIDSVDALLRFYPRDYLDFTVITPIADLMPSNRYCIRARIVGNVKTENLYKKNVARSTFTVKDHSGQATVILYHSRNVPFFFKANTDYIIYGVAEGSMFEPVFSSPIIQPASAPSLQPVYRLTQGITSKEISRLVLSAFEKGIEPDPIPESVLKSFKLCSLEYSLKNIHLPESHTALAEAKRRLVFEELFTLQAAFSSLKARVKKESTVPVYKDYSDEFFSLLPFSPTSAQERVTKECIKDMLKGVPLNRLIQGDVGSGKTAVAAALCHTLYKNGYQSAVMAPTEILAEQHFATFNSFFKGTGIKCGLLTGSLTAANKRRVYEQLSSGEIDLCIGTHALISDGVEFKNLGLVITDEQHRFGVAQRARLTSKGNLPHRLVMSATPIPRTLALIIYGDLDISIIDEYPKNRQVIESYCVPPSYRPRYFNFLKKHIEEGRQAYIVCPLVEDNDSELVSAEEYYNNIKTGEFKNYTVGLLHGKMKAQEKEAIMNSFKCGDIQLLVCTTVIEVGIDVPNATVMVIENAERFGMSALHQLRGRIGRGQYKSTCIFVSENTKNERLVTMCQTSDGFKIADKDLKMRGPGDFMGRRQHGLPELKIADLSNDMLLLHEASKAANELINNDPLLEKAENRLIKEQITRLIKDSDN
ncbi:MAG: ATP-dependent DNA helicase RecG [Clostridia bacterium]|nr:ATP-dependent DNA helicase RecG [Clostridia bacterium]